jgi:hypothetical protein
MGISWKRLREESKQERKRKFRVSEHVNQPQKKEQHSAPVASTSSTTMHKALQDGEQMANYGSPVVTLASGCSNEGKSDSPAIKHKLLSIFPTPSLLAGNIT